MLSFSDDYQEHCIYLWDMRDMTLVAQLHTDIGVGILCALHLVKREREREREREKERKKERERKREREKKKERERQP